MNVVNKEDEVVAVPVTSTERSQRAWEIVVKTQGVRGVAMSEITQASGAGTTTIKKQKRAIKFYRQLGDLPSNSWIEVMKTIKQMNKGFKND